MKQAVFHIFATFVIMIIICSFAPPGMKLFWRPIWHTPKKIIDYKLDGPGTSKQIFDIYALSHITHGILLYYILTYFGYRSHQIVYIAVIMELLWEWFENTPFIINKYRKTFKKYEGDSIVNTLGDVISTLFGVYLTHLSPKLAIIYIILSEIILHPFHANLFHLSIGSLFRGDLGSP